MRQQIGQRKESLTKIAILWRVSRSQQRNRSNWQRRNLKTGAYRKPSDTAASQTFSSFLVENVFHTLENFEKNWLVSHNFLWGLDYYLPFRRNPNVLICQCAENFELFDDKSPKWWKPVSTENVHEHEAQLIKQVTKRNTDLKQKLLFT